MSAFAGFAGLLGGFAVFRVSAFGGQCKFKHWLSSWLYCAETFETAARCCLRLLIVDLSICAATEPRCMSTPQAWRPGSTVVEATAEGRIQRILRPDHLENDGCIRYCCHTCVVRCWASSATERERSRRPWCQCRRLQFPALPGLNCLQATATHALAPLACTN